MPEIARTAPPQAILFDLDGTLIDSAPDLAAAANAVRAEEGLAALPLADLRPHVGKGGRGMIGAAFGVVPGDARFESLVVRFLTHYEQGLLQHTAVFSAMQPVLGALDGRGLPWGIVTNKHSRYAQPVVAGLPGLVTSRVLVCGDTLAQAKPHPAPLLEAARRIGVAPEACWYVGDDERDVIAGRAAGMRTAVAAWGYIDAAIRLADWQADALLQGPEELLALI
ncbi:MAG: phosphoglycolate phosphatase [Proteobacteria bacterium]|nr:phosphoglycolate phosphatase [Pseudomonadota bacterium]